MAQQKPKEQKSKMAVTVDEALRSFEESKFPADEEFGRKELQDLSGPERFYEQQKAHDEVVIDELLASVPRNRGYYLKLMKEVMPNEWEYKQRIENYDAWADLEHEIAQIVKRMTQRAPQRWGSGRYRVVVWNDRGMRGEKYPPSDFIIDAGEFDKPEQVSEKIDPFTYYQTQMGNLANFMDSLKNFMPQQLNPEKTSEMMGNAFIEGMRATANKEGSQTQMMTTMMTTMMTMMERMITAVNGGGNQARVVNPEETLDRMLGIMGRFGVLPQQNQQQPQKLTDVIQELRTLGVEPFKQFDINSQVSTIKSIATALEHLGGGLGGGEKPSTWDKIIDNLGPALPQILQYVMQSSQQGQAGMKMMPFQLPNGQVVQIPVAQTPQQPQMQIPYAEQGTQAPGLPPGQHPHMPREPEQGYLFNPQEDFVSGHPQAPIYEPQPASPFQSKPEENRLQQAPPQQPMQAQESPPSNVQVHPLLVDLKKAIFAQDTQYFQVIAGLFNAVEGGREMLEGLARGQIAKGAFLEMIRNYGGDFYREPAFQTPLDQYADKFILWLRQQYAKSQSQPQGPPQQPPFPPQQAQGNGNGSRGQGMPFQARCTACGAIYDYDSKDAWIQEMEHVCGEEQGGGQQCPGILEPLQAGR